MLKVLIDPGHGGSDPGAIANGYIEKDLNLEVSLHLRKNLQRCGFEVLMTREKDIFVEVDARGEMALKHKCTCLISVHFNKYLKTAKGCEFIYSFKDSSASWIATKMFDETVKLGLYPRGVWTKEGENYKGRNWYGVLRSSEPLPGVIAEGLFLDNVDDIKFLKDPNFLKNLAEAYAKGICVAYGIAYVPEVTEVKSPEITVINTIEDACTFLKDKAFAESDGWLKKAKADPKLGDIFIVMAKNWDTIKGTEFMDVILNNIIKNRKV